MFLIISIWMSFFSKAKSLTASVTSVICREIKDLLYGLLNIAVAVLARSLN